MAAQGLRLTSQPPTQRDEQVMSVGGIMPIMGNAALDKMKAERRAAVDMQQAKPEIRGLAAHVRTVWQQMQQHRMTTVERRLMSNLRRRNGIYDPDVQAEISAQGGSQIWMMITATKCRAASAWLRDTLLGTGSDKPWSLQPTPVPDINPMQMEAITAQVGQLLTQMQETNGGVMPPMEQTIEMMQELRDQVLENVREASIAAAERMENKMEDQLAEGGWLEAFDAFIDDLCTFPYAVLKGPVVRNKPTLKWEQTADGYNAVAGFENRLEWYRVSPFDMYWLPHMEKPEDGSVIERHRMTRSSLSELIGADGYDSEAIRSVLDEHGRGGLRDWTANDSEREQIEGKGPSHHLNSPDGIIDALEYHGSVQGSMLLEWGMESLEISDPSRDYNCCVWMIGDKVIKAQLNYDPMGRKPYYKTCYEKLPGQWCGNSVPDLASDVQDICNSAARALANNMGMSSGPQVAVNVERMPDGEDITQMHPWKIWQFTNDPMGSTAQPIQFFAPPSMAAELMAVYDKFSALADEYTGIPRYMQGDGNLGSAGRTASGISMMMGNASKIIKQVVVNIDVNITKPALEYQYYYNMKYLDDPDLKGDIKVKARGAMSIVQKEAAQVRRNEFLQLVLNSPVITQIVGENGVAEMLRQTGKTMDFPNIDKIVPTAAAIQRKIAQQQAMQQQAMMLAAQQGQNPLESIEFQRDANGQVTGANVMPGNGQQLANGAPVTDMFQPAGGQ